MKEWVRNHLDTVIVIGILFGGFWTVNERIFDLCDRMNHLSNRVNSVELNLAYQINCLDKRVSVIETIMMLEGRYPKAACVEEDE